MRTPKVGDWINLAAWGSPARFYKVAKIESGTLFVIADFPSPRESFLAEYNLFNEWVFRPEPKTISYSEYLDALVDAF